MSAQLPLALRVPPDQRFETFVGDAGGACDVVRAVATGDGPLRAVYLSGPVSSGKTHLLLAACAAAQDAGRGARYVKLVAGRVAEALEGLQPRHLVAIDGLDVVAGDAAAEVAVFDVHNRVHDTGAAVLYAARATPDALQVALPDLRSRLSQCARFALPALDDDARRDMLLRRAARRGLQVDAAAIEWLLRRVDRDPARLAELFERLDRESLAAQRAITVPFLRSVLGAG